MKTVQDKAFLLLILATTFLPAFSQTGRVVELFADRDFAVSGDTVWYKTVINDSKGSSGNIVHVQLTGYNNQFITSVARKSINGWSEGYIIVPDSLKTGMYFLSAWLNRYQLPGETPVIQKSLVVYNRFHSLISAFSLLVPQQRVEDSGFEQPVTIDIEKPDYKIREAVKVIIDVRELNRAGVSEVVIRAALADDLAARHGGRFLSAVVSSPGENPALNELDGIIFSGRTLDPETGGPAVNVLVYMSVTDDPTYFDYCYSGQDGYFHFYLKDAEGRGQIVLQAVSAEGKPWEVMIEKNQLLFKESPETEMLVLNNDKGLFIEGLVKNAFYKRMFAGNKIHESDTFFMPPRFDIPFYGPDYREVFPGEYQYLPNFQEISRELLHGVQFRKREDEPTIRIFNQNAQSFFDREPLRLISGIPVFDNRLLESLHTNDIEKIQYVTEDRVFGSLRFSGVLAVYHRESPEQWLVQQPGMHIFDAGFLQPSYKNHHSPLHDSHHIPDFRTVYYWQQAGTGAPVKFEFLLSDLRGDVEISVEGITPDGQIRKTSKTISVK
jgi:hypothetical protein